jgi:hypothetical protein
MKINISPSNYNFLITPSNNNSETFLPANMTFINRQTQIYINNTGMRTQGKFSRRFLKHSWKFKYFHNFFFNFFQFFVFLRLDHFYKENEFYQIKEFYLKGGCDDPALLREVLSRKLLFM